MFPVFLVTALGNPSSLVVLFVQINNTVTDLNLRYNKFGDAGAIAISEALKVSFVFFRERSAFLGLPPPCNPPVLTRFGAQVNKTVQVLNLKVNYLGDKGAIALAEALKVIFVLFRECSAFSWLPPPHCCGTFSEHSDQQNNQDGP